MQGKTHGVGGITASVLAISLGLLNIIPVIKDVEKIPLITESIIVICGFVGAYMVDIDEVKSKAGRTLIFLSIPFYLIQTFIKVLEIIFQSPMLRRLKIHKSKGFYRFKKMFGHRGITHDVSMHFIIWLIFLFGVKYLDVESFNASIVVFAIYGLLIGIASHIFLDSLTTTGVPLCILLFPDFRIKLAGKMFPYDSIRELIFKYIIFVSNYFIVLKTSGDEVLKLGILIFVTLLLFYSIKKDIKTQQYKNRYKKRKKR